MLEIISGFFSGESKIYMLWGDVGILCVQVTVVYIMYGCRAALLYVPFDNYYYGIMISCNLNSTHISVFSINNLRACLLRMQPDGISASFRTILST